MTDLAGRVALITGAGQGLGAAIASTLGSRGAAIAALDQDGATAAATAAAIERAHGVRTCPIVCDVGDPAAVDRAVAECVAQLGGLDVLVNNAGISRVGATTEHVTDADWHDSFDVMVHGVFYATRPVAAPSSTCRRSAACCRVPSASPTPRRRRRC